MSSPSRPQRLRRSCLSVPGVHDRLQKRESKSRKNVGVLSVRRPGFNKDGVEVISFRRAALIYRRGQSPAALRPRLG